MRLVRPFREWSLGAKLATTFLVVVAGVATLVGVAVIRHERAALDAELRKRGVNLAEHLGRLSRDLILQDDLWGLYNRCGTRRAAPGTGRTSSCTRPCSTRPGRCWPTPIRRAIRWASRLARGAASCRGVADGHPSPERRA